MLEQETMRRLILAYDNGPFVAKDFKDDANRIVLIARLIDRWLTNADSNLRLLVNHVVIVENVFGETGIYAIYEYMSNFPDCIAPLKSILYFMGRINQPAIYDVDLFEALGALE